LEIEEEGGMTMRSLGIAESDEDESNKYNLLKGTQIYRLGI